VYLVGRGFSTDQYRWHMWMQRWRRIWKLSWTDRWLLAEALFWLGTARLALRLLPSRWLAPCFGQPMAARPPSEALSVPRSQACRLGWALDTLSRSLPWKCSCLTQALAGKMMLRRRGWPSVLVLGVARADQTTFMAHAWLQCGTLILTGAPGHGRFHVLTTFVEERPSAAGEVPLGR
jgi:hypothetical protein